LFSNRPDRWDGAHVGGEKQTGCSPLQVFLMEGVEAGAWIFVFQATSAFTIYYREFPTCVISYVETLQPSPSLPDAADDMTFRHNAHLDVLNLIICILYF